MVVVGGGNGALASGGRLVVSAQPRLPFDAGDTVPQEFRKTRESKELLLRWKFGQQINAFITTSGKFEYIRRYCEAHHHPHGKEAGGNLWKSRIQRLMMGSAR